MKTIKRLFAAAIVLTLILSLSVAVFAGEVNFEYKLTVTDESGNRVTNPRSLPAGSKLYIEIEVSRPDVRESSYMLYGLEIRLYDRGLAFNYDGTAFRNGTEIKEVNFLREDSVGFAYYDMNQQGESVNNPMLSARWSYTIEDPSSVNILVPVALMYVVEEKDPREGEGNAILYLDPNGGEIVGEDVSGEYKSGTAVTLPDASFGEYKFLGWSDGAEIYPAGSEYRVTGIVTLTAKWEGINRNRNVIFDPNGGEPLDNDPGGMYADGEKIIMPTTTRDGYRLVGWTDGEETYEPGSEYIVHNSVVLRAVWEEIGSDEPGPSPTPGGTTKNIGLILAIVLGALALCGFGWWIIILWKRRWVLYSLKTGDIALWFKDKKHTVRVAVVLKDDDKEYLLGRSGAVEAGNKLRFIYGNGNVVEEIESGKYKGVLLIAGDDFKDGKKCRIKVLDREIRERKNDE